MKLLTALKRQPADNCVILTYNADLLFFEYVVFDSLYGGGCRNTIVFCDPAQYELAIESDAPRLRHAGQRYLLVPGRTSPNGAFHPKLALLTSADGGRLLLGSGNLTQAGFTRNWEVVTLFEYNAARHDATAWSACRWAVDTVSRIAAAHDPQGLIQERLEQLWGTTHWLRREFPFTSSAPVWLLHNLDTPLMDQALERYREEDGSPVREVVAISPFFDTRARAIDRLLTELRPERFVLLTQGEEHGLDPSALHEVLQRHETRPEAAQLALDGRTLHAKTLALRTGQGVWLVTGSANLSRPAWLDTASTGNTELVTLRFERDPSYFDMWLAEITANAMPMELTWEPPPVEPATEVTPSVPRIALLAATLQKHRLFLHLADPLTKASDLTVHLMGKATREGHFGSWTDVANGGVSVPLEPAAVAELGTPALVSVEAQTIDGRIRSNWVLLHNVGMLQRHGRPVQRRERPTVPEGIVPASYEQCVEILEMLHDLLAINRESLRRHRGRRGKLTVQDEDEQQMAIEEEGDYDPTDHFVEEEVRRVGAAAGADLYANFYDRVTYGELLRAALAVVYHRIPGEQETETVPVAAEDAAETGPVPPPTPQDERRQEQLTERIERGFGRLMGNFVQGTQDGAYLDEVPPAYLLELFVILMAYLRVVWRDGMLSDESLVDHSLALFTAIWGEPGQPGAWQAVHPRLSADDLPQLEARLALSAQTWLHAYLVATQLEKADDRRLYDLAAWMRHFAGILNRPAALAELRESAYQRLWRFSLPFGTDVQSASQVVAKLDQMSERYDEVSLRAELGGWWPTARRRATQQDVGGLRQVSALEVTLPLAPNEFDRCFKAFLLFLAWPKPKRAAWACFRNANPRSEPDDVRSIRFFYRGDERSLLFAVERESQQFRPQVEVESVTVEDLVGLESVAELESKGSAAPLPQRGDVPCAS